MYILSEYPLQFLLIFSIAPIIGGVVGYSIAIIKQLDNKSPEERIAKIESLVYKSIGIGILIDLPFLCIVLVLFSIQ